MSDPYAFDILTLFPEFFEGPLEATILGRAAEKGLVDYRLTDIRDFATDKHSKADDLPYGGGAGMVMKPEPLVAAIEDIAEVNSGSRVLLTPQGESLTQSVADELAEKDGLILVCGRYEGVDERVREGWIDREISIGDYVLSGGEPAALVVIDAITRLIPGVLGNDASIDEESFAAGTLEYPQYTRPREFRGMSVPDVLLSGDHGRIAEWRRQKALERTRGRRPDLLDEDDNS